MTHPTPAYPAITPAIRIVAVLGLLAVSALSLAATPVNRDTQAIIPQAQVKVTEQAAGTPPAAVEVLSRQELKLRDDWHKSMLHKAKPAKGCFSATFPGKEWKEVACVKAPDIPMPPRRGARPFVIGNGDDISAQSPGGFITQAIGDFENLSNVNSVSSPIANSGNPVNNAYTLQINTNPFASTACAGSPNPGCQGWEQFVHYNDGNSGLVFIQYWLLQYNAACPAGQNWNQFQFNGSTDIYCYQNSAAVGVPNQVIANMANWRLTGNATATGDSVSLSTGNNLYGTNGVNAVNAANGWIAAEFNIFGAGGDTNGGGAATFNNGAQFNTRTEIHYGGTAAAICLAQGFTGETNNLSFGPTAPAATGPGPAVIFTESTAGGAASNCAAATTVGDTHLHTVLGLFYDFQASGDFTLAQVAPNFEVQTRQVSGAPAWPNASTNRAVAARFGKAQVAICAPDTKLEKPTEVYVDGKPTTIQNGETVELPGGGGLARKGNVYLMAGEDGNSLRVQVNSTAQQAWLDVNVGMGRWPTPLKGLIANPTGNVNQIAARNGQVFTQPFTQNQLYNQFGDSWRVEDKASMLHVCDRGRAVEVRNPERTFYAENLEPGLRKRALGICREAKVQKGPQLNACVLDVAFFGDAVAAKAFVNLKPRVEARVSKK